MGRKKIEIDVNEVERLAGLGLTHAEICLCLGISERTLRYRKRQSADFAAAIENGRARAAQQVSNKLFERCMAGDLGAIVWYEKTRRGMSDKVQLSGDEDKPIQIVPVNYRTAIAPIAAGSNGHRSASGEDQSPVNGQAVGQNGAGR